MIDDSDIKKLAEVLATKADLKPLATRDWVLENFATKKELYLIRDELKADIGEVKDLVQQTLTAVDGFTGKVATLEQENKMGAITLERHGVNIEELATATGAKISR